MTVNTKDCLECRLISGFGLIGISAYVYHQAGHRKRWEKKMKIISTGACLLGIARLFNLSQIKSKKD